MWPKIKSKGIDVIACFAVNDPHVMKAWAEHNNILNKIKMISDSDCSFTKQLGLDHDYGPVLGVRSLRFSMIVKDCIIKNLFVEIWQNLLQTWQPLQNPVVFSQNFDFKTNRSATIFTF